MKNQCYHRHFWLFILLKIFPVLVISVFIGPLDVYATLIFNIARVSDTVANVSATGALDGSAQSMNNHILSFYDPYGVSPTGFANTYILDSSTMQVGTTPINFSYTSGPSFPDAGGSPWIYFGSDITDLIAGDSITGTLGWVLPAGLTFAPIGSSGIVNWGFGMEGNYTGTWTMSSSAPVPEPATMLLLGTGLVGVAGAARRRKKK